MRERHCFLNGSDLMRLNDACIRIREAFGDYPYLVGSVTQGPNFRDVDVRLMLDDGEFDELFGKREFLWSLFCLSVSAYLHSTTGLPIDFQVQRRSTANDKFSGRQEGGAREHLRLAVGTSARLYAGGGDATEVLDSAG